MRDAGGRTELFVNLGRFFQKIFDFHTGAPLLQILYVLRLSMRSLMPKGLAVYRLLGRDQQEERSTSGGQQNDENFENL